MQKCPRFSSQKETALVKSEQFSRELKIFSQRKNTFFYRIFEIHFKSFEFLQECFLNFNLNIRIPIDKKLISCGTCD